MASKKRLKQKFQDKSEKGKSADYKLGLSLQGGGSYGSFMHGVLKALLEAGIDINEITGTSAGSVTASLLSYGLNEGGNKRAIEILHDFWQDMKDEGRLFINLLRTFNPLSIGMGQYPNLGSAFKYAASMAPEGFVLDRLKGSVNKYIKDWDMVGSKKRPVHINAVRVDPQTDVRSHVVFSNEEINADTVMASCSLHELGPTVIDGVKHYDGGYWQNPAVDPLEENKKLTDLLFITIQRQPEGPHKAKHQDDAREENHDSPGHQVLGEEIFDHIEHVRMARPDANIHVISLDVHPDWDDTSRVNTDPRWLQELEDKGYEAGKKWVEKHFSKLGKESSYQAPKTPKGRARKPK